MRGSISARVTSNKGGLLLIAHRDNVVLVVVVVVCLSLRETEDRSKRASELRDEGTFASDLILSIVQHALRATSLFILFIVLHCIAAWQRVHLRRLLQTHLTRSAL